MLPASLPSSALSSSPTAQRRSHNVVHSTRALTSAFEAKKHVSFLLRCLRLLPQPYTSADDQRMTLGYFAVSGLDLLHSTSKIPADEKAEMIDWVYEQQLPTAAFRGSPSTGSSAMQAPM